MPSKLNKFILIIDDSIDNCDLLTLFFESRGYQVQSAQDGQAALSMLNELTYLPDLILLDAQMPIMNGYQFRTEQMKFERLSHIPVVIMSGDSSRNMLELMKYPEGIITKPLRLGSLLEKVLPFL